MRIAPRLAITAAAAACVAALAVSAAAEPMPVAQIAELADGGDFEFRGFTRSQMGFEDHIWRFSRDGRVRGEFALHRGIASAMGVQFGLRSTGIWHRSGDRICIEWAADTRRFDGCYGVLTGRGRMVHLTGPQFLAGTFDRSAPSSDARTAERPSSARPFGR